ncbi:MAG: hypothetical protein GOMPHAMPRED_003524 [Gomphillus americanus]|uniref:Uncharacterized protein n=1 Tax=Gomphillus americanus TaxID=1940652 RepID=A0A8H3FI12_9LECA|nr:MAG: hypothetical protein GOMPHAMPRED_003524 [Gomphillus americanus]
MPLIIPGMQGNDASTTENSTQQWLTKLAGKKLGEKHDETTFAKDDLPKEHRVVSGDSMTTMDHNPQRMNVHVADDGTVRDVKFG